MGLVGLLLCVISASEAVRSVTQSVAGTLSYTPRSLSQFIARQQLFMLVPVVLALVVEFVLGVVFVARSSQIARWLLARPRSDA